MLGIHIERGNTKGWFGQGTASALLSIATLVLLLGGSAFGIFAAMSARGETNVNQPTASTTPATPEPTSPTPISPTPSTTVTPTPQDKPEGKVWTVEELASEFWTNRDKHKEGEIFQISGVYNNTIADYYYPLFVLGPPAVVYDPESYGNIELWAIISVDNRKEKEILKTWQKLKKGDRVVVRATYIYFSKPDGFTNLEKGVELENSTLISVTPAK